MSGCVGSFRAMELPGLHKGQRSQPPAERVQAAYYCKRNLVHRVSQKVTKPFTEPYTKWSIGASSTNQSQFNTVPSDGWNASSVNR